MSSSSWGRHGDIGGGESGVGRDSGESAQLEFRGRDAEECENFINSVSRKALAAGKQRDDRWSAVFAASCFTGGALGWWGGLDERTQSSWRLLRQAMLSRYRPLFYGMSGEEAEEFVRLVQERALDAGKQQDNEWIAAFISSCFVGDALRWYSLLDLDVQDDWKRLRKAILTRYPREDPKAVSVSTIPTPASAGPPAPSMVVRQRGRIRVVPTTGSTTYYVAKKPNHEGFVILTAEPSASLHVEYNPSSNERQALHIPDDQIQGFDLLEMQWISPSMAFLCGTSSNRSETTLHGYGGTILRQPWQISSLSPDVDGTGRLVLSVRSDTAELYGRSHGVRNNCHFYLVRPGDHAVSFFLEPI